MPKIKSGSYGAEELEQIRLYAADNGVTRAAARMARMRNTPKWEKFIAETWANFKPPPQEQAQELEKKQVLLAVRSLRLRRCF